MHRDPPTWTGAKRSADQPLDGVGARWPLRDAHKSPLRGASRGMHEPGHDPRAPAELHPDRGLAAGKGEVGTQLRRHVGDRAVIVDPEPPRRAAHVGTGVGVVESACFDRVLTLMETRQPRVEGEGLVGRVRTRTEAQTKLTPAPENAAGAHGVEGSAIGAYHELPYPGSRVSGAHR